jgi:glycine hydroxymethyltransferase
VTTRGMKEPEMDAIAGLIARVLKAPSDDAVLKGVSGEVHALAARFPLYARLLREVEAT